MVTGASVLAIKYKDGIMMASDTLGNYSSLFGANLKNFQIINFRHNSVWGHIPPTLICGKWII